MAIKGTLRLAMAIFPALLAWSADDKPGKKPVEHETEIQMLETAAAQAGRAPASVQAFLCYQIAQGYGQVDRAKGLSQLKRCFRNTLTMEDSDTGLKTDLQFKMLDAIFSADDSEAKQLASSAEPRVRSNIQSRILEKLVAEKKFDEALALINQFSYTPEFPYKAAATLMLELPPDRDQDRRLVFAAALSSYRLEDPATDPHLEDLATLVVRFWRRLPAKMVMDSVDEILDHAKKDLKNQDAPTLTVGTALGEAQFSSGYQFRLFELLPIIQELDSSRATSILNDNQALAAVMKNYPQGLQSLEPTFRDSPLKAGEAPKFTMTHRLRGAVAGPDPRDLLLEAAKRQAHDILVSWQDDPRNAIQKAAQLPDIGVEDSGRSPRADTLARISLASMKSRPEVSAEAMKELLKVISDYPPLPQGEYLLMAAGLLFRQQQAAEAKTLIEKALKAAAKLYEKDTNRDDPNRAFKLDWPSAAVWRACVVLQDRIEPSFVQEMLKEITDIEIRASVQALVADTRLGVPLPANTVKRQFGKGTASVTSFPIVH